MWAIRRKLGGIPWHTATQHAKSNRRVNNYLLHVTYTEYINSSSGMHTCPHTRNQTFFRSHVYSFLTEVFFAYVKEKNHLSLSMPSQDAIENPDGKGHQNNRREWQLPESTSTAYKTTTTVITCARFKPPVHTIHLSNLPSIQAE